MTGLVGSSGSIVKYYSYDAFGNEKNPVASDNNPFRYCGEYFDKDTGTYYLRARYYDPKLGRFLTADTHWNVSNMIYGDDPVEINGKNVPNRNAYMQSMNLYAYCVNNPIMYIDSSGEFILACIIVGAIVGAVVGGAIGAKVSYDKHGEIRWQYVVGGAVVGAVIGGVVGYGIGSVLGVATGSQVATSMVAKGIASVSAKTTGHIMAAKHAWDLVVSKVSWDNVSKVVQQVIEKGTTTLINTGPQGNPVFEAIQTINNQTVVVRYTIIDGVMQIADAWVKTK